MRALSMLIKPASGNCNMRCKYCFYADVSDKREVKNHGIMSLDVLETLIRAAFAETTKTLTLGFQGGEPTLAGLDFFREVIRLEKIYNVNKIQVSHTIQTNGMLIDVEWASFLAENNFLTGLSLDGPKSVHDSLRTDAVGEATHSRCMKAARILDAAGAEYNILTVVTRYLAAHPDKAYSFYKRENFNYIQFIPCLDGLGEEIGANPYSLNAEVYGKFLCRVFDLWYADFVKGRYISIRAFDNYIRMLAGFPPENCAMGGVCGAYALVEADGSVYPCDFYAVDEFYLGNIASAGLEEMLGGSAAKAFAEASKEIPPQCKACEFYFICRNGCRRDREPLLPDVPALNRYCESYKMFFAHALPNLRAAAMRAGRNIGLS